MPLIFTVHPVENKTMLLDVLQVSSASIVILDGRKILWTHHKERGWDIPGGHVEQGESILEALHREVREEVGASIQDPMSVATISSNATDEKYVGKVMCIFATRSVQLFDDWIPADDIDGRAWLGVDEAMKEYHGDREGLLKIIEIAKNRL